MLARLRRQCEVERDGAAASEPVELYEELRAYPGGETDPALAHPDQVTVPLRLRPPEGRCDREWVFHSATTVFGTPMNVTVAELAIESFLPADEGTARALWESYERR